MKKALTVLSSAVLSLGMLGTVLAVGPSTIRVDASNTQSDAEGCGGNQNPCNTIQAGVNNAESGDRVLVAAGVYPETVTVNKTLILRGAQAGNDANRGRKNAAKESVVGTSNGGFQLSADDIVLDGFTVQDADNASGITTSAAYSGYTVIRNIIQNNVFGISLDSNGENRSVVRDNRLVANNLTGAANGNGIYSDHGQGNVVISNNTFTGHQNAGMLLIGPDQSDITIADNTMKDDSTILVSDATNVRIVRNININSNGTAIYLGGDVSDAIIANNTLRGGLYQGIALRMGAPFGQMPNTNVRIVNNKVTSFGENGLSTTGSENVTIANNTFTSNGQNGIQLEAGSTDSVVANNTVSRNADSGIYANMSSDNDIRNNTMRGNSDFDALDNTAGLGTAGTANTWLRNNCRTSSPEGLCK